MSNRLESLYSSAYNYHNGLYGKRDYKRAYEIFKNLYEKGYSLPDTCFYMGYYSENGLVCTRDYKTALKYYREGEKHQSGYCVTNIGKMYYDGRGVKRNYKKAFEYYKKAVELDDTLGYTNLAYCYEKGIGTKKNPKIAIRLYRVPANRGESYSIEALNRLREEYSMKKSLYDIICESISDEGRLPDDFMLPSYEKEGLAFADGAMDGVALYHMGPDEVDEEIQQKIEIFVKAVSDGDFGKADGILAEIVEKVSAFSIIDDLQHCIYDHAAGLNGNTLYNYANYLLTESEGREQIKVGMEIIEIMEPDDNTRKIIRTLGLSDEFTIFALFNMHNWKNTSKEIFNLAQKVEGWGRIHAVEKLNPNNAEMKKWLLLEGVNNYVMPAYSGLICYEKAEVETLLDKEHIEKDELDGILRIIDAMLDEGPVEGISALEDPEAILIKVLEHANRHMPLSLEQYEIINNISDWQEEEGDDDNPEIESLVDDILGSDACRETVKEAVKECKGIRLARTLKIPYKEDVYRCLKNNLDKNDYAFQYLIKDPEYTDKIIKLFVENTDLEKIKTGPEENLGFGGEYKDHHRLSYILSLLVEHPQKSEVLIETAIQSLLNNNRNQAINNVREWIKKEKRPLSELSPRLYEIFADVVTKEVSGDIRIKIDRIVAGEIEFSDVDEDEDE